MSVTYFKLDYRKHGYPGDITKGCALTGCEIDDNFHFLRGDDKQELSFIRIDESKIVVPINIDVNGYVFDFDKDNGKIIITYPNGEKKEISVFALIGVFSDDTLIGKGTNDKPLGISNLYKTGTYKPVQEYVEELPESPLAGYRAISKETIDSYGRLYTYEEILKIDKELKENGSPWRIPTKADWDKMLNSIELCDDDKNHDSRGIGDFGKNAGEFLKTKGEIWVDTKGVESSDIYGFSVIPVGRRSANGGYETGTYRHHTYFWTMGDVENNDVEVYTKAFKSDSSKVSQKLIEKTCSCSLRLVRDYNNESVGEIEDIMGISVPCVLMPKSRQVWTKVNVSFKVADGQEIGNTLRVWNEDQEYYHPKKTLFINEYQQDGSWIKKELLLGDSVVIAEHVDAEGTPVKWHEWRVLKNEQGEYILVDTVEVIKQGIIDIIHQLEELLNKEIEDRKTGDEELSQKIDDEKTRAEQAEQVLGVRIDSVEVDYKAADVALGNKIEEERIRAIQAENGLANRIGIEVQRATDAETELTAKIEAETQRAETEETRIEGLVSAETSRADAAEKVNAKAISDETIRAKAAEEINAAAIANETERATGVENGLNTAIVSEENRATAAEVILEEKIGASKEEVTGLITEEHDRAVGTETQLGNRLTVIENDYLKSDDKTELATKIDNEITQRTEEYNGWKIVEITPESSEFATSYELRDKDGNKRGSSINILKDKFIKEVKFGKFTWTDEDGNIHTNEYALRFVFFVGGEETKEVYVTVDDFLHNEFGKGLEIVDGKIQVKLNTTVEDKYLKVTDEGLYTEGISKAIADGDKALGDEIRNEVKGGVLVDGYKTLHEIGHTVPTELENEKVARASGDEDLQGKIDSLTQQVSDLETKNQELKERLDELESRFESRIKAIISETVLGVQNQIKVTPEYSPADPIKLIDIRIGFDDTAQFIADNI